MTVVDMQRLRMDAACAFERAAGLLTLLEQCERATGQPWVRDHDRAAVRDTAARWRFVRDHNRRAPERTRVRRRADG